MSIKNTFEKFKECIYNNGYELVTNYEDFEKKIIEQKQNNKKTNKIRVDCRFKCGHIVNMNIASVMYNTTDSDKICQDCLVYDRYKQLFYEKNCKLITSFEEIGEWKKFREIEQMTVKYIATCGHESTVGIKPFKECYGLLCKKCMKINQQKVTVDNKNGMEDKFIEILSNKINDKFDIELTDDGCLADFALRFKDNNEDKWLMVQVKTTEHIENTKYSYTFGKTDKYKNCIIICACINNDKLWIFDGNKINTKNISISKSKKHINEVTINELYIKIIEYMNILPMYSFDKINIPVSKTTQVEQNYRKHREQKCNYLNFIYPTGTNLRYDFEINEYKIQEKVATKSSENAIHYQLSKTNGNKIKTPYEKGDNDFYWVHFPDKQKFIIFPEQILIDENYIKSDKTKGRTAMYINVIYILEINHKWNKYLFDYNDDNETKLSNLFKK